MPQITLYRQVRRDGGTRTGIEVDEDTAFSRFEEGAVERDAALVWYVDVRCTGSHLPQERGAARAWLLRHSDAIAALLRAAAEQVPAGYDPVEWPLQTSGTIDGAGVTVACSAVRRAEARQLAQILQNLAAHLRDHIESLQALPAA